MFNQMVNKPGELESRAGISMAAPTIEAFSNADNVSEDRSLYKGGRACDRATTLTINERGSPAISPLRSPKKKTGHVF